MLDEILVKNGSNFIDRSQQIELGKKIIGAQTFDTFNGLPFNSTTRINQYFGPISNPQTPQTFVTRGLSQLAVDVANAKERGFTARPLTENGRGTYNMKITDQDITDFYRKVIAPQSGLLDDEKRALNMLRATLGIEWRRGLSRLPLTDEITGALKQRMEDIETARDVLGAKWLPFKMGDDGNNNNDNDDDAQNARDGVAANRRGELRDQLLHPAENAPDIGFAEGIQQFENPDETMSTQSLQTDRTKNRSIPGAPMPYVSQDDSRSEESKLLSEFMKKRDILPPVPQFDDDDVIDARDDEDKQSQDTLRTDIKYTIPKIKLVDRLGVRTRPPATFVRLDDDRQLMPINDVRSREGPGSDNGSAMSVLRVIDGYKSNGSVFDYGSDKKAQSAVALSSSSIRDSEKSAYSVIGAPNNGIPSERSVIKPDKIGAGQSTGGNLIGMRKPDGSNDGGSNGGQSRQVFVQARSKKADSYAIGNDLFRSGGNPSFDGSGMHGSAYKNRRGLKTIDKLLNTSVKSAKSVRFEAPERSPPPTSVDPMRELATSEQAYRIRADSKPTQGIAVTTQEDMVKKPVSASSVAINNVNELIKENPNVVQMAQEQVKPQPIPVMTLYEQRKAAAAAKRAQVGISKDQTGGTSSVLQQQVDTVTKDEPERFNVSQIAPKKGPPSAYSVGPMAIDERSFVAQENVYQPPVRTGDVSIDSGNAKALEYQNFLQEQAISAQNRLAQYLQEKQQQKEMEAQLQQQQQQQQLMLQQQQQQYEYAMSIQQQQMDEQRWLAERQQEYSLQAPTTVAPVESQAPLKAMSMTEFRKQFAKEQRLQDTYGNLYNRVELPPEEEVKADTAVNKSVTDYEQAWQGQVPGEAPQPTLDDRMRKVYGDPSVEQSTAGAAASSNARGRQFGLGRSLIEKRTASVAGRVEPSQSLKRLMAVGERSIQQNQEWANVKAAAARREEDLANQPGIMSQIGSKITTFVASASETVKSYVYSPAIAENLQYVKKVLVNTGQQLLEKAVVKVIELGAMYEVEKGIESKVRENEGQIAADVQRAVQQINSNNMAGAEKLLKVAIAKARAVKRDRAELGKIKNHRIKATRMIGQQNPEVVKQVFAAAKRTQQVIATDLPKQDSSLKPVNYLTYDEIQRNRQWNEQLLQANQQRMLAVVDVDSWFTSNQQFMEVSHQQHQFSQVQRSSEEVLLKEAEIDQQIEQIQQKQVEESVTVEQGQILRALEGVLPREELEQEQIPQQLIAVASKQQSYTEEEKAAIFNKLRIAGDRKLAKQTRKLAKLIVQAFKEQKMIEMDAFSKGAGAAVKGEYERAFNPGIAVGSY